MDASVRDKIEMETHDKLQHSNKKTIIREIVAPSRKFWSKKKQKKIQFN